MQNSDRNSKSTLDTLLSSSTEPKVRSIGYRSLPTSPVHSDCNSSSDTSQDQRTKERTLEWILKPTPQTEQIFDPIQTFMVYSNDENDTNPLEEEPWPSQHSTTSSSCIGALSPTSFTFSSPQTRRTDHRWIITTAIETKQAVHPTDNPVSDEEITSSLEEETLSPRHSSTSSPHISYLDTWLTALFSHTLSAQLQNTHFIGGAEDENTTLDFCPWCAGPPGDEGDEEGELHMLRCRYACEERERLEGFVLGRG